MADPIVDLDVGQARVEAAVVKALRMLAAYTVDALEQSGWDESVMDLRWQAWQDIVDDVIMPVVERVYGGGYEQALTAAGEVWAPHAEDHLLGVRNRMVGVGDEVFSQVSDTLAAGRAEGESIPKLAARVDTTLRTTGTASWRGRARTVARTEVIGAHNAGHHQAAAAIASSIGSDFDQVAKRWSATLDNRVRESHAEADGQVVMGMDTPFDVGGDSLQFPGDPAGQPQEVINCRCTVDYLYPGDPDYPSEATTALEEADPEPPFPDITLLMDEYAGDQAAVSRVYMQMTDVHRAWAARNWERATAADYAGLSTMKPGSIAASYKEANPGFGSRPAYGVNCQNTVTAFDMRMRGYNVTALPAPAEGLGNQWMHRWYNPATESTLLPLQEAEAVDMTGRFTHESVRDSIEATLSGIEAKAGERRWGIVYCKWKGRGEAHVFNWVKDGKGPVRFVDPQPGRIMDANDFRWLQMEDVIFARTDHLSRPKIEGVI